MRRSEVKEAFQEFRRLKKVVDGSTLSPEDDTDARISLWNQVKLLREQVETYRESNLELLTSEEQQELDAVECARVLHTPLLRARSRSISSDKSRSREPSVSRSFEILTIPINPSAPKMSSSTSTAADEARKRLRMEEEMLEYEAECRKELSARRTLLLEKAVEEGLDVSALGFLSPSSPGRSKSAAASDELTKLLGSQRIRGNVRDAEKFGTGTEAFAKFMSRFTAEVLEVPGVSDEEKFTALCDRVKDEAKDIVDAFIYEKDKGEALEGALKELRFYFGKKVGDAQAALNAILEGKEVAANSVEQIKALTIELQKLVSYAKAQKDGSFLTLDATVLAIVRKRFPFKLKTKFSSESFKAEADGEKIDVPYLIDFLKAWYTSLNRTYGMSSLLDSKDNNATRSSPITPSVKFQKAKGSGPSGPSGPASGPAKSVPKANVAAADASRFPSRSWSNQGTSWRSGNQQGNQQGGQQWNRPRSWLSQSVSCAFCQGTHSIETCSSFLAMNVDQRRQVVFAMRRCYKCLGEGHRANQCSQYVVCNQCGQPLHHGLLH